MEKRPPKETDQLDVEMAFLLIKQLMEKHNDIEPTLWASAVWSILIDGYNQSGMTYEDFIYEVSDVIHHYKPWFDKGRSI